MKRQIVSGTETYLGLFRARGYPNYDSEQEKVEVTPRPDMTI